MKAVLFYQPSADVMTKAPAHYPAHKAHVELFHARGDLLAVGTWADLREGSMAVFRTRDAAEQFVREDPFVLEGVVASHQIRDWKIRDWNGSLL